MKFVQNGNDELATYRFISRNSNRFCCSPFGIDAGEDVENQ
jgi:hypothetical protein